MPDLGDRTVFFETDASNVAASNPGWPESMAPSRVNDAARALQGALTRDWDQNHFTITSTGSANAYVLTYSVAPAAYYTGMTFKFTTNFAVTGSATVNVNTLGAKTIKKDVAGVKTNLSSGDMASGQYVIVEYDGTDLVWTNWQGPTAATFTGGALTTTTSMTSKDFNEAKGAAVASAGTTNIWTNADGNFLHITGTTTITSFGTAPQAGAERVVIFDGILTLTHNSTSLILPGAANITTAAGDRAIVRADTTANMIVVAYTKASGAAVVVAASGPTTATVVTTSGTTADATVTGTPTRITIGLNKVSGTGSTTDFSLLLGTGGGIITANYSGSVSKLAASAVTSIASPTTALQLTNVTGLASIVLSGTITLVHIGGNIWSISWALSEGTNVHTGGGNAILGAQITTVRLSLSTGTFDNGSYTVAWD